jgi:transcriptional regulator with XRE-family HTH domain
MPRSRDLPRDIGEFIRDLRHKSRISLRQLAEQAGVSNPYLSQIERGLRRPSAEVLAQLAGALRVSTPLMYLRAGLLEAREGQDVLAAISADSDLTASQKQSLIQIYETFRRENARAAEETAEPDAGPEHPEVSPVPPDVSPVPPDVTPVSTVDEQSAGAGTAKVRRPRTRRNATTDEETR